MRKFKTALLSILAFVLGLFCLASCGEKENSGEVNHAGTYKFESMTMPDPTSSEEGATITITVGQEMEGMTFSADYMVIELKDGGIAVVSTLMGEAVMNGTWTKAETEGQIVVTVDDDPQTFTCDGTTMTMEDEGIKITLKKSA